MVRNGKIISLKNDHFKKIRLFFRKIVISRVYEELDQITDELMSIPSENSEAIMENHRRQARLRVPLHKSILICPHCYSQDKDMYYNAYTKEWVCVDCVDLIREEFKEKAALYEQGQHYGDYDFMYFGSFLK